ncbi:SHOCT domain-containing protein [Roseomonas sp. GCM10028921]
MREPSPETRGKLEEIARRHGVSAEAAMTLLRALAAGGGGMAQFSHPELGGMGQWSRGGMVMVGDMFNQGLKARVDALCTELAGLVGEVAPAPASGAFQSQYQGTPGGAWGHAAGSWWPGELGSPAASGAQNGLRYAWFPASRRLAVEREGRVRLYDTGRHSIGGVSQQQGAVAGLSFSTESGSITLDDLRAVDAPGGAEPQALSAGPPAAGPSVAPQASVSPHPMAGQGPAVPGPPQASGTPAPVAGAGGDPLGTIERLADLRARGILTEEEFTAKKAELLARL